MPSLSIVIPSYNRAAKLIRLLRNIEAELIDSNESGLIHVLLSDNASTDDTQSKVSSFATTKFELEYFRQERNIGFDGNVRFLYDAAETDYVWFFSDDDILLPGAIAMVQKGLAATEPEVLLFSFIQPPGSEVRTFNLPDQYAVITEPKEIIRFVSYYPKVSIYVCRKVELSDAQRKELEPFYENGFYWIDLCYSVLFAAIKPRLCIISQPLACCDDDFMNLRFGPSVFLRAFTIFQHPFVCAHLPNMAEEYRVLSYYSAIQLMFAVKMGSLRAEDAVSFEKEMKTLRIPPYALLRSPRALMQYLALRLKLVPLYKIYKKMLGRTTQSKLPPEIRKVGGDMK